jgi:hypothetical protein
MVFALIFFWLATHSLEKYLKAVLLMNGRTATSQGYQIIGLYDEVRSIAGVPLLPEDFVWPSDKNKIDIVLKRSVQEFVSHLHDNGNADNRYLIYGYVFMSQDLHMLDQLIFNVRRLICELDARVFDGTDPQLPTFTHREVLEKQPQFSFLNGMPLDNLIRASAHSEVRNAALNNNFAFAPNGFGHPDIQYSINTLRPVIQYRIFEPLASNDPQEAKDGVESAYWLLHNVKVPGGKNSGLAAKIEGAIQAAKSRHNI